MTLVTGVGGLPHLDPLEAIDFIDRTADVPYLASLPNRDPEEGMLRQWGDGLCDCGAGGALGLEHGAPAADRSEAFVGAMAVLGSLDAATPVVKTQATGPVTLGLAMVAGGHPGGDELWGCLVDGLADRIEAHLATIRLHLPDTDIVLLLDEPALGGASPEDDLGAARDVIAALASRLSVRPGIHCCGDAHWAQLVDIGLSAISFDPGAVGRSFISSVDAVARAVSEGTRMIWGAVPTVGPPTPSLDLLVSRIRRIEGALVMAGADLRRLGDAWVSPACGLSALTPEQAFAVAKRVAEVAEELH